jgi:hypothetical protein
MSKLVKYDAMCRAISEAYRVDEVKDIRDKAVALETYSRQAHNVEAERQACEIRLRAERKAGALSKTLEKSNGGSRTHKSTRATMARVEPTKAEQLHAAGISPRQAKQWEKLATVPQRLFDEQLADRTQMPTTNGIIRTAEMPKVKPVSADALWLWGRLRNFERDLLRKNPSEVMETLTDKMKDDVHTLAPQVASWLRRIGAH